MFTGAGRVSRGGYSNPVALGAAAEQDASNVASYSVQWGEAIGTGVLAENNKELVTGGTVYTAKKDLEDAIAASSDRNKALEDADFQGQIDDTQTYVNGEFAKLDTRAGAAEDAIDASNGRIKALEDADFQDQIDELKAGTGTGLAEVNHRIDNVDSKINKVGAGAAALAALHPLDTDNKFSVAAGFGNYRDANAMALGLFYRPTDRVMFSMGGSLGNGENMINAGVSFALDKGVGTSKAVMARKIAAQDEKIAAQDAEIAALKEALARLEAKIGK